MSLDPQLLSAPAQARRQRRLDRLTTVGLRALSGDPQLVYRNLRLYDASGPLHWTAPHLACQESDGLLARRALADAYALRRLWTRTDVHLRHAPQPPLARLFYEWFEIFRVETLVPDTWPGARRNIARHFRQWSGRFHDSTLMESRLGPLLFGVIQLVHWRLHRRLPEEHFLDTVTAAIRPVVDRLGPIVRTMARATRDPARFAPASHDAAMQIAHFVEDLQTQAPAAARLLPPGRRDFYIAFDLEGGDASALPIAASAARTAGVASAPAYRVFTHEFDAERSAAKLVPRSQLQQHALTLAAAAARLRLPLRQLARELAQVLQQPQIDDWLFEQEYGRIDARRLTQLVTSPLEQRLFQLPRETGQTDAALTLLIDCSGSMRQHAQSLALFAMTLNRMAAIAQVPLEVLGFSTRSWNGGRARALWQRQRQPADPGRVAERLHLVFQSFDMRPIRGRQQIAALLRPVLYREGLDGEAVAWAGRRLAMMDVRRRILLVLSDGCPSETATSQLNGPHYLEQHLHAAVSRLGRRGIEVLGLGLGLDLRHFYPEDLPVEVERLLHASTFSALWRMLRHPGSRALDRR